MPQRPNLAKHRVLAVKRRGTIWDIGVDGISEVASSANITRQFGMHRSNRSHVESVGGGDAAVPVT
jgi:hypothetical protein